MTHPANFKEAFPVRLAQARAMLGFSLRELSERMSGEVSHAALQKYEKGGMLPSSDVLIQLADALDRSPDFFFRPLRVSLEGIEFRRKSKLPAKSERSIRERSRDFFERYLEVEQLLGLDSKFHNPLANVVIRKRDDVETAADKLRSAWKLGQDALPNVVELLEDHEVKVLQLEADDSFDGLSGWAGSVPVVVLNSNVPSDRKRFTALHELGHLMLNFPDDALCSSKDIEHHCHAFASSMLMPKDVFDREFGGRRSAIGLVELVNIKASYGISIAAIMARAHRLDFVSDQRYKRFCITMNQNGWRKNEPGAFAGSEQSSRFDQLLHRAVSTELVSLSKGAELAGKPLAEFRKLVQLVP